METDLQIKELKMNLTEYNAMPEGDLKLAVRLAVTMGWTRLFILNGLRGEFLNVFDEEIHRNFTFNPFTDASIPYGLIGRGVDDVGYIPQTRIFYACQWAGESAYNDSKTHAILNAYCAADPLGQWANFLKGS